MDVGNVPTQNLRRIRQTPRPQRDQQIRLYLPRSMHHLDDLGPQRVAAHADALAHHPTGTQRILQAL